MKPILKKQRNVLASILFILAISVQLNAQDTIHCFDGRYYWSEPCNYSDYPDSIYNYRGSRIEFRNIGSMTSIYEEPGKPPTPIPGTQYDKILTQQMFTDTVRRQIYGIAGTTIGCCNPNGCYFYLYKKINNTFVVLDSAEWTHRNTNSAEKKYIEYDVRFPLNTIYFNDIEDGTLTLPDTNIVEIHEAYFNFPIAVEGEFYIGTNWNGIDPIGDFATNYTILGEPYTSSILVPLVPTSYLEQTLRWVYIKPDNSVLEFNGHAIHNCFFPIMQPPPCVPINAVQMDNLTNNSAHISWEQSYLSSYYQIEYGPSGFQHGSGVFIDNVTTTNYTLQNLATGTEYIAYIRSYCSGTDTMSNWKCIKFKTLHSECPAVEDLDTTSIGTKMATIEWKITDSEITLCQIEWGEAGFEHGSGTVVNNIHDSTYTFRNLTPNTAYDVYIRTYCERSGVFGAWQQLTFTTDASTNVIATADNDISVELHPNPTSGIITLSRNDVEKVEVIDAVGKTVMVVENKHIIDLTKLGQGHYTLRITLPEGVVIRKVIRK